MTAEQGFTLTSPAFQNGEIIPVTLSCDGSDHSPQLDWMNPPEGTRSYALVVDDPDAPTGTFTHWILYDLPVGLTSLPEGANNLGKEARNDFGKPGYGGPCPPPKHGDHRYYFRLHALDVESLDVPDDATRAAFDKALEGHVLDTAELMGRFQRG